ncbi:MAG: hypothetical protein COB02_17335 [Candidatus Cloacimonadota bacterium]|nr:MAG: hypothetical protein COB02_17335 [Candidatus Cloacimonadota bacterium]
MPKGLNAELRDYYIKANETEKSFYEALRRDCVEKIASSDIDPLKKRFEILAQLTKLRQACCHPSLVIDDSTIEDLLSLMA